MERSFNIFDIYLNQFYYQIVLNKYTTIVFTKFIWLLIKEAYDSPIVGTKPKSLKGLIDLNNLNYLVNFSFVLKY